MADKKYLKVNPNKKTITIDFSVKPTATDEKLIEYYIKCGYVIREKSEARAAAARERAKKNGFGTKKAETKEDKKETKEDKEETKEDKEETKEDKE